MGSGSRPDHPAADNATIAPIAPQHKRRFRMAAMRSVHDSMARRLHSHALCCNAAIAVQHSWRDRALPACPV